MSAGTACTVAGNQLQLIITCHEATLDGPIDYTLAPGPELNVAG